MDWDKLFTTVKDYDKIENFKESLNNNLDFHIKQAEIIFEYVKDSIALNNTIYYFLTEGKMYNIRFDDLDISIDKRDILRLLNSYMRKINTPNEKIKYFDDEFIHHMYLSTEVSSGFSHFADSVKQVVEAIEKGGANFDENIIFKDKNAFDEYLKKRIYGYDNLFKSIDELLEKYK